MALQVTLKKETLHFEGRINCTTARMFIIHVEYYAEKFKNIVINIDEVSEIDNDGMEAIKKLWLNALKNSMNFSIRGFGCRDIYEHFETSLVA